MPTTWHGVTVPTPRVFTERMVDDIVFAGVESGDFATKYPKDAARAVSTMCVGVSTWFNVDGPVAADELIRRNLHMARCLVEYTGE